MSKQSSPNLTATGSSDFEAVERALRAFAEAAELVLCRAVERPSPTPTTFGSPAYQAVDRALRAFEQAKAIEQENPSASSAAVDVAELMFRKACAEYDPERLGALMAGTGKLPASDSDRLKAFRGQLFAYHQAMAAHRTDPSAANMDAMNSAGLDLVAMHQRALCGTPLNQVLRDVEAERCAQVAAGYDAAHDDGHTLGEIGIAAGLFALTRTWKIQVGEADQAALDKAVEILRPASRRTDQDRRKKLVIAAALAVAEIERLDRAGAGMAR